MQITPDFIIDYFVSEGFDVEKVNLINGYGDFIQKYQLTYGEKGYYVYQYLKPYQFLKYILYVLCNYFFKKKLII